MTDLRKAAEMALEALDYEAEEEPDSIWKEERDALRQALETEQEPVAWISEGGDVSRSKRYMDEMGFKCNPLYTAPPKKEWVGLTDEEIDYQAKKDDHGGYFALGALWAEAKLKEKNT